MHWHRLTDSFAQVRFAEARRVGDRESVSVRRPNNGCLTALLSAAEVLRCCGFSTAPDSFLEGIDGNERTHSCTWHQ